MSIKQKTLYNKDFFSKINLYIFYINIMLIKIITKIIYKSKIFSNSYNSFCLLKIIILLN